MTEYERLQQRLQFQDRMANVAVVLGFVFLAGAIVWGVLHWPGV